MNRFALLLSATVLAVSAAPSFAQPAPPERSEPARITVMGEGEARSAPDLAVLSLTVLRTAQTADVAMSETNEAASAVIEAMRGFEIEGRDLQTGGFSITPQYRYENQQSGTTVPPQIVGYEVRNSVTVRVRDLDRLGEILDRAVDLGVNQGGDISFMIDDPSELENEARTDAFEQARRSAETLARAAGRSLGEAREIADETATYMPPPPMPMMARGAMAAEASMTVPVEIGENTITSRVRVVFELN